MEAAKLVMMANQIGKFFAAQRGADVVADPVGGDVFDESTRCVAFGGKLMVVGFTSGRIADIATNIPLIKGFSRRNAIGQHSLLIALAGNPHKLS